MRFALDFCFEFGHSEQEVSVSERSKQIAQQFQAAKRIQATRDELDLRCAGRLDEGFKKLCEELQKGFQSQCDELNQESAVENILGCDFSGDEWGITRSDSGAVLSVKLDAGSRKVVLECDRPAKFRYELGVKPTPQNYYFADGKGKGVPDRGIVVDKALRALLGLDWKA